MPEIISLLEFGRRVGTSSKTIERYIKAGKIHGAALHKSAGGKDKVDWEVGQTQYAAARELVEHRFVRSGHTLDKSAASPDDTKELPFVEGETLPVVKPKKAKAGQAGELVESGPRRPQPHGGNLKSGPTREEADISGTSNFTEEELNELTVQQLTKREAVLRVLKQQIDVAKSMGQLADVRLVDLALHEFGTEIRVRFEAIPARVTDSILAEKTSHGIKSILAKEINNVLSRLAEYNIVEIMEGKNRK